MDTRRLLVLAAVCTLAYLMAPAAAAQEGPSLFANFVALEPSGPLPLEVEFRDLSSGDPTSWEWDFGDGSDTSAERNPVHRYERVGKYTVSLTVSNASGSDRETKYDYIVAGAPTARFSATPTSGMPPLAVQFTDLSDGGPLLWYAWDFGDGALDIGRHPSHTYRTAGTYTVTLTVSNAAGSDTQTKSGYIAVRPRLPVAAFTATQPSGFGPLAVHFTDRSTNEPRWWHWNFGDGSTSSEQNPTHIYRARGFYTVTLTVDGLGGSDTATEDLDLRTAGAPAAIADFSGSPTSGVAPLTVHFTDHSEGSPFSWRWDFGDGSASSLQNPSHTYYWAGSYTVSLTVSGWGSSDTETKGGYIYVNASASAPMASFSASPTSGPAPLTVRFTDQSANHPTSWSWDFGDGGSSSEQSPTHTYDRSGIYSVRLTVSNPNGRDAATKTISASFMPRLAAGFTASPTSGTAPLTVSFQDRSTGSPITWRWDFGDGSSGSGPSQSHTYQRAGRYTVSLTVSDFRSSDTATESIQVTEPRQPAFP